MRRPDRSSLCYNPENVPKERNGGWWAHVVTFPALGHHGLAWWLILCLKTTGWSIGYNFTLFMTRELVQ